MGLFLTVYYPLLAAVMVYSALLDLGSIPFGRLYLIRLIVVFALAVTWPIWLPVFIVYSIGIGVRHVFNQLRDWDKDGLP